jgi:hypothetical protein
MAKVLYGGLLCLFLFLGTAQGVTTHWVYQEAANSTGCTNVVNVSDWDGAHACALAYDSDWGTYAQADWDPDSTASVYNATYAKPAYAVSAKWEIKADSGAENWTVAADCFDDASLKVRAISFWVGIADQSIWSCWDAGDGDWSNVATGVGDSNGKLYEEAIYWEVNNSITGGCGATLNSCTTGTFLDVADAGGVRYWMCKGSYGGNDDPCSLPDIAVPGTSGYVLSDIGAGMGGLFDGISMPLAVLLMLLGVAVGIGAIVLGISGKIGK